MKITNVEVVVRYTGKVLTSWVDTNTTSLINLVRYVVDSDEIKPDDALFLLKCQGSLSLG